MTDVSAEDRHILPPVIEIRRNRWAWGLSVPWLPDLLTDHERLAADTTQDATDAYRSVMQSLVNSPPGSAFQIRLVSLGDGLVQPHLVGKARTQQQAGTLARLVMSALPVHLPMSPVAAGELPALLAIAAGPITQIEQVAEIRRRPETADPLTDLVLAAGGDPLVSAPVLLPWRPGPHPLRTAVSIMRGLPTASVLCLHVERSPIPMDALTHCEVTVRERYATADPANPFALDVLDAYTERLRSWPRGVLTLRVLLAAGQPLPGGLAESVAIDLTSGAFDVVHPRSEDDLALALELLEILDARNWAVARDPEMAAMAHLVSPTEAAGVVRLPTPPPGGLPGVATRPVSMLPRSPQSASGDARGAVHLGRSPYGGAVDLTLGEVNQHVLVAGLPGFGKTTTVQALLLRLARDHGIPFLVIDPAKSDYAALAAAPAAGLPVRRVVLDAQSPAFNPFAVPEGASQASHAGRVLAAFDAALMMSTAWELGFITFGRGLFAAYEQVEAGEAPTLRSLYAALGDVIRRSRFAPEAMSNARASLLGRLEFLVRGPMGVALTSGPSGGIDWADLLSRPTVIELRRFAGPTERSLIFALLIAGLLTYREANPTIGGLAHVTVLEEAHRALGAGAAADSEGARLLVEGIAELRGSGEGFVIVDQAPTTLHPAVMKLAGSVLTHRVVERAEREALGASLLLDERQSEDLARLPLGRAVLYGAQRQSSVVVDVEAELLTHGLDGAAPARSLTADTGVDPLFCRGCRSMCQFATHGRRLGGMLKPPSRSPQDVAAAAVALMPAASRDLQRCIGAHALAATMAAAPTQTFRQLDEFDEHLSQLQRAASEKPKDAP